MSAVFTVVAIGSVLEGRTLNNLVAYVLGLGVTLAANVGLTILHTPAAGIAWASFLGQLAAVAVMAFLSHRSHPVPYPFGRSVLVLLTATFALFGLGRGDARHELGAAILWGAVATIAAALWIWFAVLTSTQRVRTVQWLRGRAGVGRPA
jgi:O-antigen/teichoic acid export membrane protein